MLLVKPGISGGFHLSVFNAGVCLGARTTSPHGTAAPKPVRRAKAQNLASVLGSVRCNSLSLVLACCPRWGQDSGTLFCLRSQGGILQQGHSLGLARAPRQTDRGLGNEELSRATRYKAKAVK